MFALNESSLHNSSDLVFYIFQSNGINVDSIQLASRVGEPQGFMQPLGKIVRHEFQERARFNEVILNAVDAHTPQHLVKFAESPGYEFSRDNDDIGGAEIKCLPG